MKTLSIAVLTIMLMATCNRNEENITTQFPLRSPALLKLVKMSGGMLPSVKMGDEMSWQETYTFENQGSFVKSRTIKESGATETLSGTYQLLTVDKQRLLLLIYKNDHALLANCSIEPTELLMIVSDSTVINDRWVPCDGPELEYQWFIPTTF